MKNIVACEIHKWGLLEYYRKGFLDKLCRAAEEATQGLTHIFDAIFGHDYSVTLDEAAERLPLKDTRILVERLCCQEVWRRLASLLKKEEEWNKAGDEMTTATAWGINGALRVLCTEGIDDEKNRKSTAALILSLYSLLKACRAQSTELTCMNLSLARLMALIAMPDDEEPDEEDVEVDVEVDEELRRDLEEAARDMAEGRLIPFEKLLEKYGVKRSSPEDAAEEEGDDLAERVRELEAKYEQLAKEMGRIEKDLIKLMRRCPHEQR